MSNKLARLLDTSALSAAAASAGIALASAIVRRRAAARSAATWREVNQAIDRMAASPPELDATPLRRDHEAVLDLARSNQLIALARRTNAEAAKLEMEVAEARLPPADDGRSPVVADRARMVADAVKGLVLLTLTDTAGREYQLKQSPRAARAYARGLLEMAELADEPGQQRDQAYAQSVRRSVEREG